MNKPDLERGIKGKKLGINILAGVCLLAGLQFMTTLLFAEELSDLVWTFDTAEGVELDAATSSYRISPEQDRIVGQWVFPAEALVGVFDVLPAAGDAPCFSFGEIHFTYASNENDRVELFYWDQTQSDWLSTGVYARDETGWRSIEVRSLTNGSTQLILDNAVIFEIQGQDNPPVLNVLVEQKSETYLSEPDLFGPPPSVGPLDIEEDKSEGESTTGYTVSRKGVVIDYNELRSRLAAKGIKLPAGALDPRKLPGSEFVKVLEENAPPARGVVGKPSSYGFDVSENE